MMQTNRTSYSVGTALIGLALLAGHADAQFVGKYSGEFMAAGAGARALAMGGSGGSVSGDPWSLFYNPAGLATISRPHLGLMHSERFEGVVDYDAVSYSAPESDGRVLTLGLLRLGVNGIPYTRIENPGQPLGDQNRVEVDKYVTDGQYAFYAARSGSLTPQSGWLRGFGFDWGIAPKLIFHHQSDYRAYGIGLDAGVLKRWEGSPSFAVGASLKDVLGTLIAWEQTGRKELIVSTLRLGGSMMLPLPALEADLSIAADGVYRTESLGNSDASEYYAGLEYMVRRTVALRGGMSNGEPTFGGGINLRPVSIDYAFIGHDDLGDTHRISLTARWGR